MAEANMSDRVEVEASPTKLMLIVGGALIFIALGIWLVRAPLDEPILRFIGWASIVTFGTFGFIGLRQLMTLRGAVLTMSREGLRDLRVSTELIPWSEVEAISTWSHQGQKVMILKLTPACEARLPFTWIVRATRAANRKLGADGVAITSTGLKISYDKMLSTAVAFKMESDRGHPDS